MLFLEDIIDEREPMRILTPHEFDEMMSRGWRAMGEVMTRHNFSFSQGLLCSTIPLRIDLARFKPSKGHQKLLRRAAHLTVKQSPIRVQAHHKDIFIKHTARFTENIPSRIWSFLSEKPDKVPVSGVQIALTAPNEHQPFCYSFSHYGHLAYSATYCCFDPQPQYTRYSPGVVTMLLEIENARQKGCQYYYHGYIYDRPSSFDYKLHFEGIEAYHWKKGEWIGIG
jgi:leucyl-tRNA---protein transferase